MPTPVANPAGLTAVQDILKEVWVSDTLESQLYEDTVLLDWVEDVKEYTDSDGLSASIPLRTGRTGGVSARAIGQQLTPADQQRVAKAKYNYKNLYLQVQVNGPIIAKMATNRQACVREIDFEVKNGVQDFKRDMHRQMHGHGTAQLITEPLPTNASSTTVLLGAANYYAIERGWLYVGQVLDIGTLSSPTSVTTGVRITGITDSATAPAITIDTAVATTAGTGATAQYLFLYGNRSGGTSNEINGLGNIVSDTGVLGALDPSVSAQSYWKAVVEANGGTNRALSISLLNTVWRKVRQRGEQTDVLLSDLIQQQKYYELLQPQVRFAGDTSLGSGKVDGPKFNNVSFLADPDALPGRVYFLNKKSLQTYSAGDIAWQNQTTGGDVLAWRQDYDAFVGRAAKYMEMGTNRRVSNGLLKDLSS